MRMAETLFNIGLLRRRLQSDLIQQKMMPVCCCNKVNRKIRRACIAGQGNNRLGSDFNTKPKDP